MKKRERVKSKILFNEIINNGKKESNKFFTIFFIDKKDEQPLFGISAPKKTGNAVTRNKLKRQTRELIKETKLLFKNNRNYIIIIKKSCLDYSFQEKLDELKRLIGEINEK